MKTKKIETKDIIKELALATVSVVLSAGCAIFKDLTDQGAVDIARKLKGIA